MSKSLKRVRAALDAAGIETTIQETSNARTAAEAAAVIGCKIDQIAKSIIFVGQDSGRAVLFLTAGGQQVSLERAQLLAREPLGRADAATVRAQTGFAIGGVSPVGHIAETRAFMDQTLFQFDQLWAAAGTPNHVFSVSPMDLQKISAAKPSDFIEGFK